LNKPGKYYINDQCTDCGLCQETAPQNISRDDRTGFYYISKQPATAVEFAVVEESAAGCPTEAIGTDGDHFDWNSTPIYDWNGFYANNPDICFDIRAPLLRVDATDKGEGP
jgi:ferredoxin